MNPLPLCLWLRLEQQLQSELNLARGANDRSDGSLVCIDGSRRAEDTLSRHVEVGVVQDIVSAVDELKIIGSLIAGFFFTSAFTIAPAAIALTEISKLQIRTPGAKSTHLGLLSESLRVKISTLIPLSAIRLALSAT